MSVINLLLSHFTSELVIFSSKEKSFTIAFFSGDQQPASADLALANRLFAYAISICRRPVRVRFGVDDLM